MKKYNITNNLFGWLSFAIAAITYLLTIEPTASFWDCGEFISSAYKFEVGHPPGAPFFMLTGKFFTLFASDVQDVARMVNSMSAILSALTILFLFWTITHLAKKLIYTDPSQEMTTGQLIAIMGSGLVGALAYTFSDTFWFSAVEGEVYAYSSLCTAIVFWLILKWENRASDPSSDKWLVIIAYAIGLSIGVHLLNLLCIPAIGLVYYFKRTEKPTIKGTIIALAASFGLIVVLMYGIIPGFTKVGGWSELLFTNTFGLPYNTGFFFYIALLVASIAWGLYETLSSKGNTMRAKIALVFCLVLSGALFVGSSVYLGLVLIIALSVFVLRTTKISRRFINTAILCLLVVLIGYSSFAIIPIRSAANTPMDQNSPENVFTLSAYLNREQYGDRPLFFGKTYASKELRDNSGRLQDPVEVKESYDQVIKKSPTQKDEYVVATTSPTYGYTNTMLLPRMFSGEERHLTGYRIWADVKDTKVPPTAIENMQFFFTYQLNFMYFRYLMWNFSGRQNDIQANGALNNGNWVTGIGFIDEYILDRGPQSNLPPDIADNKGHNTYFAIPFLLAILGMAFQLRRGKKGEQQFLVTFMLFFMTGIAIIIYLNQQPFEPRERDYAFAGSFYAFSIWIGLAVGGLWVLLKKKLPETVAALIVTGVLLLVPIRMACENWDDHDRSDRYTMRDFGQNYLKSCEPNAILFTNGDNDTFPLWYLQEVEGFRTDVRVCNLSYLQTDWYVDQMRRDAYNSKALPIQWERDRYSGERGRSAYVFSRKDAEELTKYYLSQSPDQAKWMNHINFDEYFDTKAFRDSMTLDEVLDILRTKDKYVPANKYVTDGVVIPSSIFTMPIDTTKVDWKGFHATPSTQFTFNLGDEKGGIYRQEMMILEMLNNISKDNWKRPIYFAVTVGDFPLNLSNQLTLEGITYRITPGKIDATRVNTDLAFRNLVQEYKWGGIENPKVYLDENNLRMCRTFRLMFSQLVSALIEKGEDKKALIALNRCMQVIPAATVPRSGESIPFAEAYYVLGKPAQAQKVIDEIQIRADKTLAWYTAMSSRNMASCSVDIRDQLDSKLRILDLYQRFDKKRYRAAMAEIIPLTELLLKNGVSFSDRNHPLDMLMMTSLRDAQSEGDTSSTEARVAVERIVGLLQTYYPELLEKKYSFLFKK